MDQTPMPQVPMNNQQQFAQQPPKRSGLAIAGLVLGIIALVSSWLPIINNLSFFLAAIGAILAFVGLIGASRGKNSSKGLSIAGVALNVIAIVVVFATQSLYSAAIDEALSDSPTSATPAQEQPADSEDTSASEGAEEAEQSEAAQAEDDVDYEHLAIGDAVSFTDGTTVVLNEVETGLSDYDGDTITRINVTYVNDGSDSISFNEYDWDGEDENGVQRGIAFYLDAVDELNSGNLRSGGTVTGNVYLEGDVIRIIYQNNIFLEDSQVGWDVQ